MRKLCHRQEQPEGCSSKYRKTRAFYHGGLIVRWFLSTEGLCKSFFLNFRNCTVRVGPHRVCKKLHILLQKPHLERGEGLYFACVFACFDDFFDFVLGRGLAMYAYLHVIEQQN